MDGWKTIKDVRQELREATKLAKTGSKTTAACCMGHARRLLEKYCKEERGPEHGFEERGSNCSRQSRRS